MKNGILFWGQINGKKIAATPVAAILD